MKYSHIEQADWLRGEETDVEGPSRFADWSVTWTDDSETDCFYSNGQSEASSAFITSAVNGLYELRDGVNFESCMRLPSHIYICITLCDSMSTLETLLF